MNNILLEKDNYTAIITLNRLESLNALNKETITELSQCLDTLYDDESIRVILLTGSGTKAFVAGADIKEFQSFNGEQGQKLAAEGQELLFNKIENFSKPIIALVNGFALGGGLELAMACHFRIGSANAKLGLPEVTLGLIPGYGGTQRLPQLIGKGRANQAIFTAEMFTAEKAEQIGLLNEVVPQEELLERGKQIANRIASNSPKAISKAILAVNKYNTPKGYITEINAFGELFDCEDFTEGVSAFLEKRKPSF